jgi:hypothetical protein
LLFSWSFAKSSVGWLTLCLLISCGILYVWFQQSYHNAAFLLCPI